MTTTTDTPGGDAAPTTTPSITQVYRVYIKATPQAIWDAITKTEWTTRYGYTGIVDYDLRPGGAYIGRATEEFKAEAAANGRVVPDVVITGEVLEANEPFKLVTTFRMLMDESLSSEPFTRISHEIKDTGNGVCSLTLTHEFDGSPNLAALLGGAFEDHGAGGGWAWVLSDLKTLLETGHSFQQSVR
ncbi:MAG: hypothetical protein JWM93_1321 [Frankiales bacterium]|nr:hypothetical protein [Frankiales bacterium]